MILNRVLKRVVRERVGTPERLLDLYCGNGNFSLDMPESTRVVGLDHSGAAVDAAARVRPDSYRVADEETFAQTLAEPWDTIVLDPPRTGAKAIMERLARADAQTIVYVSCDPATLARPRLEPQKLHRRGYLPQHAPHRNRLPTPTALTYL